MHCRLQIRRSYRKASLIKQLVKYLERVVTRTQEWLEGKDRSGDLVIGYGVIVVAFLFVVGQVVRCLI